MVAWGDCVGNSHELKDAVFDRWIFQVVDVNRLFHQKQQAERRYKPSDAGKRPSIAVLVNGLTTYRPNICSQASE